ncbi:bifunctional metallophosphatase/5'-nucleotidase [Glaciihabitans sp. INWT7]|uniref:5'-nucleotidase C-terminal domain-containing protein n=1 Tax=Glaciihabitans sp. INWT7 TaxID=2596912 RepID=UPI001623306C|nr:5'-nucleotidase C-terminal domain-containing protein [Glaciihabitans sp. INWT7]QNE48076.1 bifunctional metallophosphatase/5'-nucleotidase [Glaciihabitans sp. INWT7]
MALFRSRRSTIPAIALAIALGIPTLAASSATAADAPVAIDILSFNDFHGRLEASSPSAGAAVLGGLVNSFRAANPNTLLVSGGDSIGASTFTSFIQKDQPTIDALNAIGVDASAIGNHELDQGQADLEGRVIPATNYPLLSANIYNRTTGQPEFAQYALKQVGGITVGFIGATTDETPSLVSPAGVAKLEFRDIPTEVNRVADQLSDGDPTNGEADVIVLTVHEGAADATLASATGDSAFGKIVSTVDANVDAIVSGHTHQAYNWQLPVPGTDRTRPVLQAGKYGESYGHLSLSVDPTTKALLSITSEVKPLFGAFAPDPAVASIVAAAVAAAKDKGSVPVGTITADFNRASQKDGVTENRGGESPLGNFVADVQLWATNGKAQVALMNPGGLRTDLKYKASANTPNDVDGRVTYQEAASVQPFANTLVTETLTGAQLKQVLEEQWQPATSTRPFLKLGVSKSLEYRYDPTAAAGSHITAITVNGVPLAATDSVSVVVNSFLASGGDNFVTLAKGTNAGDTGKIDLQSMVDYFVANPVASPDYAQRAVGVTLSSATARPGDGVTLDLSSLLFSNGEPNSGTATVSAGGVVLGQSAIDPSVVDLTDEVGRASVAVTVPTNTPAGTLVLTVAVPQTGTSIDVPLTITVPAITSVTAPTITGVAKVGRTLTASPGTWSVASPAFAYQWNRAGVPIDAATAATYTVVPADAGAAISVTVTASAPGTTPGAATSAPVTVDRLASTTRASVDRVFVRHNSPVVYRVVVSARGLAPTGDVVVRDGRTVIASATLTAADNGRVTVTLPKLGRGIHLLTATYGGDAQLVDSASWPSLVLVF